jgi:hypothetical protein
MQSEFISYRESLKEENIFLLKIISIERVKQTFLFLLRFYNAVSISDCIASNGNMTGE